MINKKRKLVAALAPMMMITSMAQAQMSTEATSGGASFLGGLPGNVLYDQTDNAAGNGVPDQDFEASFDIYDAEAADDFMVSDPGGWDVQGVAIVGTTGTPGGSTVNINFYADNGGTPAASPICSYSALPTSDSAGSLSTTLPTPCTLPSAGVYWVSHQTIQNFGSNGQHFWSNRSTQTGNESVWRNPGDGFATGCTTFTPQTTCGVGGGASPDLLFSLTGSVNVLSVPTMTQWGMIGMTFGLGLFGMMSLYRRKESVK